jgi:hypothetical protein
VPDPLRCARDGLKDNGRKFVIHVRAYRASWFAMASGPGVR